MSDRLKWWLEGFRRLLLNSISTTALHQGQQYFADDLETFRIREAAAAFDRARAAREE